MLAWILLAVLVNLPQGFPYKTTAVVEELSSIDDKQSSACGTWTPYKDEKCVKIIDRAGFETQEDAEIFCRTYGDELPDEDSPKLVTIKTKEEQEFLQTFLFTEGRFSDNIWLGLKADEHSGVFKWNDGDELHFANWAEQVIPDENHLCVQMASGDGAHTAGLWVKVTCKKRNAVVCEKPQVWTVSRLKNKLFSTKLELETKNLQLERKIQHLEQNPVPVGFIYAQLPGQEPPSSLWPMTIWEDVSAKYAGLFFRVGGGAAAPFGNIQEDQTRHVVEIQPTTGKYEHKWNDPIPVKPGWNEPVYSGDNQGISILLNFRVSNGEVRPRNQAMVLWQRTS